jgi:hypothetical protein
MMPFYFDYDLLLLAVPATLLAAELSSRPIGAVLTRAQGCLVATWVMLFLWMTVNSGLGTMTGINGTVILLLTLATQLIGRAIRRDKLEAVVEQNAVRTTAQRIAA